MSSLVKRMTKAILTNKKADVESLLKEGFPLNEITFWDDVAVIHYAVSEQRHDILDVLLKSGAEVDLPTVSQKKTALHIACWEGDQKSVERLLAAGASASLEDKDGFTALMCAVRNSKTAKLVALLLKAGAPVNTLKDGRSPIHQMINHEDPAPIQLLVAAGSDVNSAFAGLTPLMKIMDELAFVKGKPSEKKTYKARLPIIEALVHCGANPNAIFPNGISGHPEAKGMTIVEFARRLPVSAGILVALESTSGNIAKIAQSQDSIPAPTPMTVKPPRQPEAVWSAILDRLSQTRPSICKSFQRGATVKQLAAIQALSKRPLPADFKRLWMIKNGQKKGAEGLFDSEEFNDEFVLLSTTDIVREWQAWNSLLVAGEFEFDSAKPDAGVRADWYHPDWIPIASNTGGDFLCIDLSPNRGGKRGQIVCLKHDSPERTIVANSVTDLLWRATMTREK